MATSRSLAASLIVAALALAGCGGGRDRPSAPSAWAWLRPTPVPAGWSVARLPSGNATMAYPRTWRRIASDPDTVTAAQIAHGLIVGYLNATPHQANESLANWATFRPHHNAHEGDRGVRVLAAARDLPFPSGRGRPRPATDPGVWGRALAGVAVALVFRRALADSPVREEIRASVPSEGRAVVHGAALATVLAGVDEQDGGVVA